MSIIGSNYDVLSDPLSLFSSVDDTDNEWGDDEPVSDVSRSGSRSRENSTFTAKYGSSSDEGTISNGTSDWNFDGNSNLNPNIVVKKSSSSAPIVSSVVSHIVSPIVSSTQQNNPNSVNTMANLFAKLNLRLKEKALENKLFEKEDLNKNLTKKRPEPLLVMTNKTHNCYDCNQRIGPDDEKGTGIGILGVNLYFCRRCYLPRFRKGEGLVIDYGRGNDIDLVEHIRKEFSYGINCPSGCFHCARTTMLQFCRYKGITGGSLIICDRCRLPFHRMMITYKQLIDDHIRKCIVDETTYYEISQAEM